MVGVCDELERLILRLIVDLPSSPGKACTLGKVDVGQAIGNCSLTVGQEIVN